MNHETYQKRADLVRDILGRFGLKATDLSPVDYDENSPHEYNNFIYKISLETPARGSHFPGTQPLTAQPPADGVTTLVVRLGNPKAMGLNQSNRTENEVAAIWLARLGLSNTGKSELVSTVPAVYAWNASGEGKGQDTGFGWLIMDFKPGVPLNEVFPELSAGEKASVIEQLADLFAGVQRAPLPNAGKAYHGGLTINLAGEVVPGQMTILPGGPWDSFAALWKARLENELVEADKSDILQGWRANGLRDAIEDFISSKLDTFIANAQINADDRALIHCDFTTWNVLYDKERQKITGLVDFDFAYVSHPGLEFFTSFSDVGGGLGAPHGGEAGGNALNEAILTGNFEGFTVPQDDQEKWTLARLWDKALHTRGLLRPSNIAGMRALYKLNTLEGQLAPFRLIRPFFLKKMTPEQIAENRKKAEKAVGDALSALAQD